MKSFISGIPAFALVATFAATFFAPALQAQGVKNLTPEQQVEQFYALCKEGRAADALVQVLATSGTAKPEDSKKVADAFASRVNGMGMLLDFQIARNTVITKRVMVMRCVGHFKQQPFVTEFTFYNSGDNEWHVIHLRYDANPATMFAPDLAGKG